MTTKWRLMKRRIIKENRGQNVEEILRLLPQFYFVHKLKKIKFSQKLTVLFNSFVQEADEFEQVSSQEEPLPTLAEMREQSRIMRQKQTATVTQVEISKEK